MDVKEFKFDKEGHTLGNMLQMKLLEMGVHAAYKVPHPLKNEMNLLVFGEEPNKKIKDAKKSLLADISAFEIAFKQSLES